MSGLVGSFLELKKCQIIFCLVSLMSGLIDEMKKSLKMFRCKKLGLKTEKFSNKNNKKSLNYEINVESNKIFILAE
ncbi:hypothetical protein BpHYR1_015047 [Brachionus plicatilis]|uniref:Uncharacterized protein n=1 Tax=Brachionus plicatilis TaxID=10195 RepID=A0A3M7PVE8_BRAPC|nr:hypothetical protein BpHYR1_015047 [Brachionus plicatilis]